MIVLLAADYADAKRFHERLTEPAHIHLVCEARDVRREAIDAGARIVRTNAWQYNEGIVSALRSLSVRVPLVDPTGLLGPIDRREGARSTTPWGTPPIGGSLEAARNDPQRRRRSHHDVQVL